SVSMTLSLANPAMLLVVACANLLIGTYVYWRNRSAEANRAFALMATTAATWAVAVLVSHHSSLDPRITACSMLASGSMLPLTALFFVDLATRSTPDRRAGPS